MSFFDPEHKHVCHILAYYVSPQIYELLDIYEIDRRECVKQTLNLLHNQGIDISMSQLASFCRDKKSRGRFDIAIALKELGYVESTEEAYSKYLDPGSSSYVKRKKLNPFELVEKIIEYEGVPVLAHPRSLRMNDEDEEFFIKQLVDVGLAGIEAYGPNNGPLKRLQYLNYCKKYHLIPTVGSDYHGMNRQPKVEIGKGHDNLYISDDTIILRLKKKKLELTFSRQYKER